MYRVTIVLIQPIYLHMIQSPSLLCSVLPFVVCFRWAESSYFMTAMPLVAMFAMLSFAFDLVIPLESEMKVSSKVDQHSITLCIEKEQPVTDPGGNSYRKNGYTCVFQHVKFDPFSRNVWGKSTPFFDEIKKNFTF